MIKLWTCNSFWGLYPPPLINSSNLDQNQRRCFQWTRLAPQTQSSYMGKSWPLGNKTAKYYKPNLPENRCVLSENFQEAIQTFMYIFFFLCISCCMGILRSLFGNSQQESGFCVLKPPALFAAHTEIKRNRHHYLAGFSCGSSRDSHFSSSSMLAPPAFWKRLSWQNLNQTWNTVSTFLCHFCQEVLPLAKCGLLRTSMCTSSFERQNGLLSDDLKSFFTFNWMRNEFQWKGNCTFLSLTFLLSCIMVHKLLTETYKKCSQLLVQGL